MINRNYNFSKPEDVRHAFLNLTTEVKILLSMIYFHNDLANKVGYGNEYGKHCVGLDEARVAGEVYKLLTKRKQLRRIITETCKFYRLTAQNTGPNSRIAYVKQRKRRKENRDVGNIIGLSQRSLFVFAKLWEEAGSPIPVQEAMFGADNES